MKKNIGILGGLYAMAMMAHAQEHQEFMEEIEKPIIRKQRKEIDFSRRVEKVIPKGCKEYVFNESFGTLKVIAMNEKSALKKYNKWCSENES
jgi:hypothetical protein